uniref:Uncharacterized protein n=1 Tax=viral metagenome TaxID=1070528 RepID=A0A6C0CD72_9ZZZZ
MDIVLFGDIFDYMVVIMSDVSILECYLDINSTK